MTLNQWDRVIYTLWVVVGIACVGGWIANIWKLCHMDFGGITGMLIARAIGIPVGPLGMVLGYF